MDCRADRVDKALVTVVRSEVDRVTGIGCNSCGYLEVEHHFAIRVWRCRPVARVVDGDGHDVRGRYSDLVEVDDEVAVSEAAFELDYCNGLSRPIQRDPISGSGKVVAGGKLRCRNP